MWEKMAWQSAPRAGPSRGLRGQAPHPAKAAHFYGATWPVFTPPLTIRHEAFQDLRFRPVAVILLDFADPRAKET